MISMSDDTHPSSDTGVSGWFQRLVQGRGGDAKTRDEIAEFLAGFMERGVIGADEFAMLQGVLEVADTQVRDIMVPRSHMVVVAKDQSAEEVLKIITESNHEKATVECYCSLRNRRTDTNYLRRRRTGKQRQRHGQEWHEDGIARN